MALHTKRKDIEALRALAVLAVFTYHLNAFWLPSGFLGVDIFFVISGYVITRSLYERGAMNLSTALRGFYVRRAKRLLPGLIFCVAACSVVTLFVVPNTLDSLDTGLRSLFAISNFYLYASSADYFSISTEFNVFTHTWSLGVEEQYYFLYPILFYALYRPLSRDTRNIGFVIAALCGLSFVTYLYAVKFAPNFAFFMLPARFWELGIGCLAFLFVDAQSDGQKERSPWSDYYWALSGIIVLAVLLLPRTLVSISTPLVVASTAATIVLGGRASIPASFLSNPVIQFFGTISYSLYLWHWPIIVFFRYSYGVDGLNYIPIVLIALLMSCISYYLVEKPLRYRSWAASSDGTLGIAAIATFAIAITIFGFKKLDDQLYVGNPRGLVRDASHFTIAGKNCHLPTVKNPLQECLFPEESKKNIYVMGDSHARNLIPAIIRAVDDDYSVKYLTGRARAFQHTEESGCAGTNCSKDEIGARIDFFKAHAGHDDVVVFSMARDRLFSNINDKKTRVLDAVKANTFENNLTRFIGGLNEIGLSVVIVEDIPKICGLEDFARARFSQNVCLMPEAISLSDRSHLSEIYARIGNLFEGTVLIVDPHPYLCKEGLCTNFMDGKLLYADESPHFTNYGATLIDGAFKELFTNKEH